jgi:hypothetical protein
MSEKENDKEVLGIIAFSIEQNSSLFEQMFNDIEKEVYRTIDSRTPIDEKSIYELSRYNGRAQILVNFAKNIIMKLKDKQAKISIGQNMFNVINNLAVIYEVLNQNLDINNFNHMFNVYKESVDNLNVSILKYII